MARQIPKCPSNSLKRCYQQVKDAGGTVEFYTYPGDEHNITASFNVAMQRSVQFMDKYVKGLP